jgi:hypothetical protein
VPAARAAAMAAKARTAERQSDRGRQGRCAKIYAAAPARS